MWIKDFVRKHPNVIVRGSVPYSEIVERLNAIGGRQRPLVRW